ncbi:MAG TPA: hypothetical protein VF235_01075 [Actinomycetota bacterium]
MPWNPRIPHDVRTVHLGEFATENAAAIVGALEDAGIVCWTKEPGFLTSIWQLGFEVFVDRARLAEARAIAGAVLAEDV